MSNTVSISTNCFSYFLFCYQMQLVIYGKEDIHTLMDYAIEIFSSIQNKDVTRPGFAPNVSFPSAYNQKIVYSIPVADVNSLSLFFEVPPLIRRYREQVCTKFLWINFREKKKMKPHLSIK